MNIRREMIGDENYHSGMASLSRDLDRERVADWLVQFLRS